jgi:hypothetical protein
MIVHLAAPKNVHGDRRITVLAKMMMLFPKTPYHSTAPDFPTSISTYVLSWYHTWVVPSICRRSSVKCASHDNPKSPRKVYKSLYPEGSVRLVSSITRFQSVLVQSIAHQRWTGV